MGLTATSVNLADHVSAASGTRAEMRSALPTYIGELMALSTQQTRSAILSSLGLQPMTHPGHGAQVKALIWTIK